MYKIKSITLQEHDRGYGGYPFKVVVRIDIIDAKAFKKLKGNLGSLVLDVNNAVYGINKLIPSHCPSIDNLGGKNFKNGVKPMVWEYFIRDAHVAKALGFPGFTTKAGEFIGKFAHYHDLTPKEAA